MKMLSTTHHSLRPLALVLTAIFAVAVVAIAWRAPILNDDPYITFRYSWNLAHGNGFVYNPGERVAGSTAPLFALAIGILLKIGLPLRACVGVLAAVAYGLIGLGSWRLFRKEGLPWGGFALAVLLLFDPSLLSLYGSETSMAVGLALAAFALHAEGRFNAAFIAAALLVGVRPDAGLVGVVLALVMLEKDKRRLWPALGWGALAFLPFYIAFVAYYHALVPHTLAVKAAQGAASDVAPFWKGTIGFVKQLLLNQALPSGILAAIGIVLMIRRRWTPLPLFVLFYALAFCLINPPYYYYWYQYPYWLMRDAAVAWGIGWIAAAGWTRTVAHGRTRTYTDMTAVVLLGAVMLATLWPARGDLGRHRARHDCYMATAQKIGELKSASRRIILEEIGIIGYQMPDWTVYDMAGLVHAQPYGQLVGDNPPPLAMVRGEAATYPFTIAGKSVTYLRIASFKKDGYACTLMEPAKE